MPPPNIDDPLANWIYRECVHSVVFVEFRPNVQLVFNRWNNVHPVVGADAIAREAERGKRMRESAVTFIGTGSWVRSTVEGDYVLTCAHLVAPVFTQQRPITADELNQLYQPWIMCEHRERMFLEGHDNQRHFRLGNVQFVSCENDLLVIRIPRATMNHYCPEHHRPLTFATRVPRPLKKVVMISWPEYWRSMTAAVGRISNRNRLIARLGEENAFGFTTTLSEVDITSEAGSSGGPLFNGEADTVGVLHGGNSRYSYFIGLPEITATLNWLGYHPPTRTVKTSMPQVHSSRMSSCSTKATVSLRPLQK